MEKPEEDESYKANSNDEIGTTETPCFFGTTACCHEFLVSDLHI
jgi:hypothetical protein